MVRAKIRLKEDLEGMEVLSKEIYSKRKGWKPRTEDSDYRQFLLEGAKSN